MAVLSITKLFGGGKDATGLAPQVDADPTTRQLLVRGTKSQVEQIRAMLEKMGETGTEGQTGSGNVRMLPLSGRAARSALERIQEIWPTMSPNKIRVVTPSAVIPTLRPGSTAAPGRRRGRHGAVDATRRGARAGPGNAAADAATRAPQPPAPPAKPEATAKAPERDKSAAASPPRRAAWAQVLLVADTPPAAAQGRAEDAQAKANPSRDPPPRRSGRGRAEPAPIIVSQGPGGIMIASQDTKALDRFEQLLNALASGAMSGGAELTIFYLKHAKAASVAETLDEVLGGGTTSGSSGGGQGGGLMQDIAGAAMGETGGNLVGALMGMGGGGTINPTGSIRITADPRLNALVVQANATDLDTIEQLLKILDQRDSPEDVLVVSKPRLIPVFNTQAEEVSKIVSQVYQDRMVTSAARGGNQQPPSPQEFIQMLRGGGGGQRGGRGGGATEEVQKMSVGVDTRTNSLVVVAPDNLFEEVKDLVEQLDEAAVKTKRVGSGGDASPGEPRRGPAGAVGDYREHGPVGRVGGAAQPGASRTPGAAATPTPQGDQSASPEQRAAEFQRRMEFFRQRGGEGFGGRRGGRRRWRRRRIGRLFGSGERLRGTTVRLAKRGFLHAAAGRTDVTFDAETDRVAARFGEAACPRSSEKATHALRRFGKDLTLWEDSSPPSHWLPCWSLDRARRAGHSGAVPSSSQSSMFGSRTVGIGLQQFQQRRHVAKLPQRLPIRDDRAKQFAAILLGSQVPASTRQVGNFVGADRQDLQALFGAMNATGRQQHRQHRSARHAILQ